MAVGNAQAKMLLMASIVLLLSGLMQIGTAWLQHRSVKSPLPVASQLRADITKQYTWIDDDFPNSLPLKLESVALTIENSRHYALDSPDSDAEYQSIYPGELGFLRLGPNKRFFSISMYHQLHCLDSLRKAIVHGSTVAHGHSGRASERREQVPHVDHCLNYLRQTILCNADLTLEPEVILGSQDVQEGLGVTHVCRDWGTLDAFIEQNYKDWKAWRNNSSKSSV